MGRVGTTWALLTGLGGGAQGGLGATGTLGLSLGWATGCLVSSSMWLFTVGCWGIWDQVECVMPLLLETAAPGGQDLCRAGAEGELLYL